MRWWMSNLDIALCFLNCLQREVFVACFVVVPVVVMFSLPTPSVRAVLQ